MSTSEEHRAALEEQLGHPLESSVEALLADRDQWRSRALEAEDRIDGQAWEDLERDRDRLRTELARAESTIAALEDPEVRAALESETTGDFGSVPDPRSAPGAPPWDIARLCGDSTGPNGVGGPCVLPPGHPHVDGIGGMWPAAPGAPTPAAQQVLAAACAYADSAAAPTDTPHEDALLDAVAAYRAASLGAAPPDEAPSWLCAPGGPAVTPEETRETPPLRCEFGRTLPAPYPGHPHATAEHKRIAEQGMILRVEVGSTVHGISVGGDDRDELGTLPMPEPHRSYLRSVRAGAVALADVLAVVERADADLARAAGSSTLPDQPDYAWVNSWLHRSHLKAWEVSA